MRITRTVDGFVEPDPGRTTPGRGAYLCRSERCLSESVRRGRWAQAFRAPTAVRPDTLERLRDLVTAVPSHCPSGRDDLAAPATK